MRTAPDAIWGIINEMVECGEESRLIAESNDESIAIYIEAPGAKDTHAYINVTENGDNVFFEIIVNEEDCIESIERAYSLFLDDEEDPDPCELEADERDAEIEDREQSLIDAAEDFIAVLLDGCTHKEAIVMKTFAELLVDAACKSLHRKGVDVYRPMYLEDEETGDIDYYEFPYAEM